MFTILPMFFEYVLIFWHILPPDWCKCHPDRMKLTEKLHLILFYNIYKKEEHCESLNAVMAPLQRARFDPNLVILQDIYSLKMIML